MSPRSRRVGWWLVVGIAVTLIVGAGAAAVFLPAGGGGDSERTYPQTWDRRVLPFVEAVEEQRDLDFKHPVQVRFLSGEDFEKEVTTDEAELDEKDREEIKQFTGVLRALGLISGDVDLFKAFNQASGAGTLAYYSDDDKRITVKGTELTPAVHATLVHELTHALQDQQFDIGTRLEQLRDEEEDGTDTTAASVYDALVEGDAERVATAYRQSLSAKERRRLAAAEGKDQAGAGAELKGVPTVVQSIIGAPYVLGEALAQVVAEDSGNDGVDDLFEDTPEHESVLLDPFEVLTGDVDATEVEELTVADGEKKFDSGSFGALGWYFVLAERIPVLDALDVVDGWGGDSYVSFERDDQACVQLAYVGDTEPDTSAMQQALQRWVKAGPQGTASLRRDGEELLLESCDPGDDAELGNDASRQALKLAGSRSYLGFGLLQAGAPAPVARCIAGRAVEKLPLSALTGPAGDPAVGRKLQRIARTCATEQ